MFSKLMKVNKMQQNDSRIDTHDVIVPDSLYFPAALPLYATMNGKKGDAISGSCYNPLLQSLSSWPVRSAEA
jgi:hypothetical protein